MPLASDFLLFIRDEIKVNCATSRRLSLSHVKKTFQPH
jgi:hypothetical protein